MSIDLSLLPPPSVVEPLDFETILATIKADVLAVAPELADVLALESEPASKFTEVAAYRELLLRARINAAAGSVMLPSSTLNDLDNLAALFEVDRLVLSPADLTTRPPTVAIKESDRDLRRRVQLAPEGATAAGSREAYRFYALSAHSDVSDVQIESPSPGEVAVYVLSRSGDGVPSTEVLAAVLTALSAENVRPICDYVTVHPVELVPFTVSATLYVQPGPALSAVRDAADAALQAYLQRSGRIGADVPLSGIYAALHQPGVVRVELAAPRADIECASTQVAYCAAPMLQANMEDGNG